MLLLFTATISVYAEGTTEEIVNSKNSINEKQKELNKIKAEQAEHEKKAKELKELKTDVSAYIGVLDDEIAKLEAELSDIALKISATETDIENLKRETERISSELDEQYNSMKLRIRYMYESSTDSKLRRVFESGSVSDFLNQVEYSQKLGEYDRRKLTDYENLLKEKEAVKQSLDSEIEILSAQKEELLKRQNTTEELKAGKEAELKDYEERLQKEENESSALSKDAEALLKAIKAEEANIARIEAEIKRREEEARKKAEAEGREYKPQSLGDIIFTWPCPSSSRITSEFGGREAPVKGASTTHKGIDIGAPSGEKVIAAADGEVVIATYSTSAGNYVMLSHGGNVYTVYMHMKSIAVSVGQSVSKGEKVGTVGSTGYSTGPHLHFGIRVNGDYVNPLNYVAP
ncbi:MAG: peptidoglycan DD-metalloendopeptidase family protein [Eubacteriales bacterium]|nr:peptidoglycan DD-metalloendopeptidase family protein [Eubacteriales bacterium]